MRVIPWPSLHLPVSSLPTVKTRTTSVSEIGTRNRVLEAALRQRKKRARMETTPTCKISNSAKVEMVEATHNTSRKSPKDKTNPKVPRRLLCKLDRS